VAGAIFLLFCFAAFFSSFLPRAMTAAAAGIGASIAVLVLVSAIWSRLDLLPRIEPQWMALELGVIGAIVLLASLFVFSRGEMLRGRGVAGTAASRPSASRAPPPSRWFLFCTRSSGCPL